MTELVDHLATTRADFLRRFDAVPPSLHHAVPPGGGWTPAQVLDHLARIERMITIMIDRQVAAAREAGLGPDPDDAPQLATFKGHRILNRSVKVTAPERGIPGEAPDVDATRQALSATRAALLDLIGRIDGLDLGRVAFTHANLGEMTMYQWIAFIGFHEGRHTLQLDEIVAAHA